VSGPVKRWLVDLTDERFKTDDNRDVIEFIRRTNPFAHSDVGDRLIRLGQAIARAHHYSPSFASYAYVVLHTESCRIFGIAYGQRGLAFRMPEALVTEALADGARPCPEIGPGWVAFDPWPVDIPTAETLQRLQRWCERAFAALT